MSLGEFLALLRKRWAYVLVPVVVVCAVVALWSVAADRTYTARASVYFSLPFGQSANDLQQGANFTQQQVASYAQLATQPVVLGRVIHDLGLETSPAGLAKVITASPVPNSVIVEIEASASTAERAAQVANSVAGNLGRVIRGLAPKGPNGQPAVNVSTVGPAVPPEFPSSPNTKRNLLAAGLGSLLLAVLLALAREKLDTRVRRDENLPSSVGVLGSVAYDPAAKRNPLAEAEPARGGGRDLGARRTAARREAFRRVRTTLKFIDVDKPVHVLVVTSSVAGEGKTSVTLNLAKSLGDDGNRVLVIEGDLRRPRVGHYLGMESAIGLTDVLAGAVELETALQPWAGERLFVLPSGSLPPNPSELLGSQSMSDLLERLRESFDFVLIDTPPLLPVIDAAVVGAAADGVLLVVRNGRISRQQLTVAMEALSSVEARLLGVVFNRDSSVSRFGRSSSYYGSYDTVSGDRRPEAMPENTPASA